MHRHRTLAVVLLFAAMIGVGAIRAGPRQMNGLPENVPVAHSPGNIRRMTPSR